MYLTIKQCELMRSSCDRFEVALRSLVANCIVLKLDKIQFDHILKTVGINYKLGTDVIPIYAERYRSGANAFLNSDIYNRLEHADQCMISQTVLDGRTLYVGEIVNLIVLFYNPIFTFLGKAFPTPEHFLDLLETYHSVRNDLAHPASAKILEENVQKALSFFTAIIAQTPQCCFWYSPKNEIQKSVEDLRGSFLEILAIKINLSAFPNLHSQLLMRDSELSNLRRLFFGETPYSRTVGSVELHGYGGVGKTAIAVEFCFDILKKERDMTGTGYSFLLWLSSKTEELKLELPTGNIRIQELKPAYSKCADITAQLSILLGLNKDISENDLVVYIHDNNIKGLVVVDNLETISNSEKIEIGKLISRLPSNIQFLVTSRNYEGIGNQAIEIKGFGEIAEGRVFISKYCASRGYLSELSPQKTDLLIDLSCGNTLILVLCLERIIDGKASLDSILSELQIHKESEIEFITDFMYKNTFQSIIDEVTQDGFGIDFRTLIGIMFLYQERIDFHSLRELLNYDNAKNLEKLLNKLVTKFVIIKTEGYYELHEFAEKYVVLRFLPDKIRLRELSDKIKDHKNYIKQQLVTLYEHKETYGNIKVILDDWKAVTEIDTIAIAMAYSEHNKVRTALYKLRTQTELMQLINSTEQKFSSIEARSFHPYIKFQKARVFTIFIRQLPRNIYLTSIIRSKIREIVAQAYYETYYLVAYAGHSHVANTESYAAFLWLYGIYLSNAGKSPDALNIFEESVTKFSCLKTIRNPHTASKASSSLALCYAITYLENPNEKYLNKVRTSVNEALRLLPKISSEDQRPLTILLLFSDVFLNSYRFGDIKMRLKSSLPHPLYLLPIVKAIEKKIY